MYEYERGSIKGIFGFYHSGTDAESFSQMKAGKEPGREDEIERKYQEAVALLPADKEQAVREYCDAIFDSGAEAEQFFYRLGLRDGIRMKKTIKKIEKSFV